MATYCMAEADAFIYLHTGEMEIRSIHFFKNIQIWIVCTVTGELWAWGNGGHGQLGHGTKEESKRNLCLTTVIRLFCAVTVRALTNNGQTTNQTRCGYISRFQPMYIAPVTGATR